MVASVRQIAKRFLPRFILQIIRHRKMRQYTNLSTEQVFTKIYRSGAWGKSDDVSTPFFSGAGSHRSELVAPYIQAVRDFLISFDRKQVVVDLGCGDFFVGSQIRSFSARYIACDVVPKLIEFNTLHFQDPVTEFRLLDIAEDDLPAGDIACVRQVLQHLSNAQIQKFVDRALPKYNYMIVTEHLPATADFKPNKDIPMGPGTRIEYNSGVVLTAPPFNLRPTFEKELCRVELVDTGVIVTTLYAFK
jgi:hypothetical protein